jgi:hypothetical protein
LFAEQIFTGTGLPIGAAILGAAAIDTMDHDMYGVALATAWVESPTVGDAWRAARVDALAIDVVGDVVDSYALYGDPYSAAGAGR